MNRLIICMFLILPFAVKSQIYGDSISALRDSLSFDPPIFEKVEFEAAFTGGEKSWRSFLEKNLNPNVPVDKGSPSGKFTVMVQFMVNKEGGISDVKALTKHGYGMEQEVIRLIKNGPAWTPAMQNGRPVNAYRKQPVTFMISDESYEIRSKEPFVLYMGLDNLVTVVVDKVKPADLRLTITEGSILSKGDGNYIIRVNKTGRTVIEIFNAKKGNKEIGSTSFEVK